ncbi:MAG: MarR family winged helix-turn-helix transcriptional regulator [Candidatus Hinthialibacter sp.]
MTQERPLTEEIFGVLRRIIRVIDSNSRYLAQKYGLTGPQLSILQELSRTGEIPSGSLAKKVNLSNATVTDILDRLEKREFIIRTRSIIDKRRVFVKITEKGREILVQTPSVLQEHLEKELKNLQDWEKTLLLSSLQRIAAMLESNAVPKPFLEDFTSVSESEY